MALSTFLEEFRSNQYRNRNPKIEFPFEKDLNNALSQMPNELRLSFLTVFIGAWINEDNQKLEGVFKDQVVFPCGEPLVCVESAKGNCLDFCWRHPKTLTSRGVSYEDEALLFSVRGSGTEVYHYLETLLAEAERKNPMVLPCGAAMYFCWSKD
jgi:hypothetical protein